MYLIYFRKLITKIWVLCVIFFKLLFNTAIKWVEVMNVTRNNIHY